MTHVVPVLLCLTLPIQIAPPKRYLLAGKVLERTGRPSAQAQVWLVSRPLSWSEAVGQPDVVRATTGKDGKFEARVLPGRIYSAWAVWRTANQDRVTLPIEGVLAGQTVTLQESRLPIGRRLRIKGLERWRDRGPLRFRLRPLIRTMWTTPLRAGGDTLVLPPVPMTEEARGDLEVLAADGSILDTVPMLLTSRTDEPEVIDLGRFFEIRVGVLSGTTSKPIEGATIRRRPWSTPGHSYPGKPWGMVGTTGADGHATIRVLADEDPRAKPDLVSESWIFSAPGHADVLAGCDSGQFFIGNQYLRKSPTQVTVTLPRARPLTGRVLLADGRPAVNLPVVVAVEWNMPHRRDPLSDEGPEKLLLPHYHGVTGADGRFQLSGIPSEANAVAGGVLLSRTACPELPAWGEDGFPVAPRFLRFETSGSRPASFGTLDLAQFECVRLQFSAPPGKKATSLHLRVHRVGVTRQARLAFDARLATDPAGRVGLLLRKGRDPAREYEVLAWARDLGWALHRLEVPTKGDVARVTLLPFVTVTGKVVSPEGKPIAYAMLQRVRQERPPRIGTNADIAHLNRDLLIGWADDKGEFEVRYVPNPYHPPKLIAIGRHTRRGPEFRSPPYELGPDPKRNVKLVLEVAEDWLQTGRKNSK